MRLDPEHFDVWFQALNEGRGPFPWQRRLFRDWLCPANPRDARWPSLLGLPTASGKTALIDLAVLALAAGSPCARRRIAFVVDRRVVVDEATLRAAAVAARLRDALATPDDPLHEVAQALMSLGGDQPLVVATLRGGMPGDDGWARSPAQPAVILSTVDQVGSGLLFRAYGGHGPRSWPIHAGLLGRDTLLVIDEAHCAVPFCETVQAISERWQELAEHAVGNNLTLVRMSATPGEDPDFTLDDEDRRDGTLAQRLRARKPAELVLLESRAQNHRTELVREAVERANRLATSMGRGVVGIVVNRVADARAIFERLDMGGEQKLLLTGRVRGWERDDLLLRWLPRLRAGNRELAENPLAVVATQCIEVGANLDFDALITEVASLDALRQRFGRLNRLGHREAAHAVILATARQVELGEGGDAVEPDAVYGHALARTWAWLQSQASGDPRCVDLGIDALELILPAGEELSGLCQEVRRAYPLLPSHLDLLAQTSPPPEPSPEISAYLHGTTASSPDVTVVWRADLPTDNPRVWADRVAVQPPLTGEGCPVPIWEFRRWLCRDGGPSLATRDLGDVEGVDATEEVLPEGKRVLRWRGLEEAEVLDAMRVSPGDTVVVPSTYGGCDRLGWNPWSLSPVEDIGDAVAYRAKRRPVLRLGVLETVLRQIDDAAEGNRALHDLRAWANEEEDAPEPSDALRRLAAVAELPDWLRGLARSLAEDRHLRAVDAGGAYAITGRPGFAEELSTADDRSTHGIPVPLVDHVTGVQEYTRRYAAALGLPEEIASDLAMAGWLHDVGKADPRFQLLLHGGDEIAAALAPVPLAKSGQNDRNRGALRRARQTSGYPRDARHEAQSLALIMDQPQLRHKANDWDLVQHLVASHHGFARPFLPVAPDPHPLEVALTHGDLRLAHSSDHQLYRLDAGVAERYWRLVRRYGWWGLAWLEAVLRLADQRRSEHERRGEMGHG